jgi:hypothetical protein
VKHERPKVYVSPGWAKIDKLKFIGHRMGKNGSFI